MPEQSEVSRKGPALTAIICSLVLLLPVIGSHIVRSESPEAVKLPRPAYTGEVSLEKALLNRRSVRDYKDEPLSLEEASQLLWAAQGVTDPRGLRTAPSAGALYPLEVYLVAGKVSGLPAGVYKYRPQGHALVKVADGDKRAELSGAGLGQASIAKGAAVMVLCAVYERTARKYGDRAERYAHFEVGCASQNIYLQAVSLNLGTVFIGAFHDDKVKEVLNMADDERTLCVMPVGRK